MPDKIFISLDGAFNQSDHVKRELTVDAAIFTDAVNEHGKKSPAFVGLSCPQVWPKDVLNGMRKTLMRQVNRGGVPADAKRQLREWLTLVATANQENRLMYWVHYQA